MSSCLTSEGPGVVVGRKGNVGAVYWSHGPFFAIDTTYWVRSTLPPTYCYYALREMDFLDSHAAVPGRLRVRQPTRQHPDGDAEEAPQVADPTPSAPWVPVHPRVA